MSDLSKGMKNSHRFMGVPREEIDWFPTIDYNYCNDCGDCITFCGHGVFEQEVRKVIVKKPKNCVVFCQACLKMCPIDHAMIFQPKKEVLQQIKQIKKQIKTQQVGEVK
ncbi:MAG: 4Fe-4S dicluster domain-containing protein [Promethearchaeota archaeon]